MSLFRLRIIPAALALAVVAVTAGCATAPAAAPPSDGPGSSGADDTAAHEHTDLTADHYDVAWLDDGRAIGVVTWGSSTPTCQPQLQDATAVGQKITITLAEHPDAVKGCNGDLSAQAEMIPVPEGIDVTKDVEVEIAWGEVTDTASLAALDAAPQGDVQQEPSAGWFGDDGILLLTWGSSSCKPQVDDVEMTDAGAAVELVLSSDMCTMDMAPRVTTILLPETAVRDGFELAVVGPYLDTTLDVIG